jgi:hypothetical protein
MMGEASCIPHDSAHSGSKGSRACHASGGTSRNPCPAVDETPIRRVWVFLYRRQAAHAMIRVLFRGPERITHPRRGPK